MSSLRTTPISFQLRPPRTQGTPSSSPLPSRRSFRRSRANHITADFHSSASSYHRAAHRPTKAPEPTVPPSPARLDRSTHCVRPHSSPSSPRDPGPKSRRARINAQELPHSSTPGQAAAGEPHHLRRRGGQLPTARVVRRRGSGVICAASSLQSLSSLVVRMPHGEWMRRPAEEGGS